MATGGSVAISGEQIVVGADGYRVRLDLDTKVGVAYIMSTAGAVVAKLDSPSPTSREYFGKPPGYKTCLRADPFTDNR